jgi:hypothetical protein
VVTRSSLPRHGFGRGTAGRFSRDIGGCFGIRTRRVLDDVGVRFGGSEHHRIGISSSHPVPAFGLGPRQPRTRLPVLFGAPAPRPGQARLPDPTRRVPTPRDLVSRVLRNPVGLFPEAAGSPASARQDTRRSSERWALFRQGHGRAGSSEPAAARSRRIMSSALRSRRSISRRKGLPTLRSRELPTRGCTHGCTPPASAGKRSARNRFRPDLPPGRTVTTRRQRSQ